jgi:hypothetical protein
MARTTRQAKTTSATRPAQLGPEEGAQESRFDIQATHRQQVEEYDDHNTHPYQGAETTISRNSDPSPDANFVTSRESGASSGDTQPDGESETKRRHSQTRQVTIKEM